MYLQKFCDLLVQEHQVWRIQPPSSNMAPIRVDNPQRAIFQVLHLKLAVRHPVNLSASSLGLRRITHGK